jgi:hypothetical protein
VRERERERERGRERERESLAEAICMVRHLVFELCYWPDFALVSEEDRGFDWSYLWGNIRYM